MKWYLTKILKIQFYNIGYLDTNLSYGKRLLLPKGSTKKLAKISLDKFSKNNSTNLIISIGCMGSIKTYYEKRAMKKPGYII